MAKKTIALTDGQKLRIGIYAAKYPQFSAVQVCEHFGITRNQYEFAMKKYREGNLTKRPPHARPKKVKDILAENDSDTLLAGQMDYAIAQMAANKNIDEGNRIDMLSKLVSTRHTLQRMKLQGHLRKVDSDIFSSLVRLFVPNATDDEVISYYQKALEITRQVNNK